MYPFGVSHRMREGDIFSSLFSGPFLFDIDGAKSKETDIVYIEDIKMMSTFTVNIGFIC